MFTGLAKFKAASTKDKPKKDKSDKHDESHPITSTKSKNALKEKEKSRHAKKKKRGDSAVSQSSVEIIELASSQENSQTVFEDHLDNLKGKKQISNECEEAVGDAVAELFNAAWMVCAERFFIKNAPATVSFELRNTWLRIVEAEWQDPDIKEKRSPKQNRIFQRDEPALPLAFDSWSRGALELLPTYRRESFKDPFLRDLNPYRQFSYSELPPPSQTSSQIVNITDSDEADLTSEWEKQEEEDVEEHIKGETEMVLTEIESTSLENSQSSSAHHSVLERDEWNFDLDDNFSQGFQDDKNECKTNLVDELSLYTDDSEFPSELQITKSTKQKFEKKQIYKLFSARNNNLNVSSSDFEYYSSMEKPMRTSRSRSFNVIVRKFSPSLCGGVNGSGVFRLPRETTSEAISGRRTTERRGRDNVRTYFCTSEIEEQKAEDREDIVQLTKKGAKFIEEDDELLVHPLFEENTPRPVVGGNSPHRFRETYMRPRFSDLWTQTKWQETSVNGTASQINKRFLKRRLIHLHDRFKRQAIRSIGERAKRMESLMKTNSLSSSMLTADVSKMSLMSGSSKRRNRNRGEKIGSTSIPIPQSKSVSTVNIIKSQDNPTYSGRKRSGAKGVSSDTQILKTPAGKNDQRHKLSASTTASNYDIDKFSFKPLMANVRPSNIDNRSSKGKARQ